MGGAVENIDELEPVAPADLEIVEIVRRGDLDGPEPVVGSACSSATIGIRRPTSGRWHAGR